MLGPYVNNQTPVLVRCAKGHVGSPRPSNVLSGRGACATCSGRDRAAAEAKFRARLATLGATMLGPYVNSKIPVLVRCAAGHETRPMPGDVNCGQGVCGTCAGNVAAVGEARFAARLAELGATMLDPYAGAFAPVLVRCAAGHENHPRPHDVTQGDGFCRTCAHNDPRAAEARFQARLAELGVVQLGPYVNSLTPVTVRCAAGHEGNPAPCNVLAGRGACRTCAGKEWTVFYVVTADAANRVKFGITSLDGRGRLGVHRGAGYRTLARLLTGLPGGVAPELEKDVKATLALAGFRPVKGREYFEIGALAVILDVVDNYPIREPGRADAMAA
jgi:hypothetical protein